MLLNPDQVLVDEIPDKVLNLMEHGEEIGQELAERREEES